MPKLFRPAAPRTPAAAQRERQQNTVYKVWCRWRINAVSESKWWGQQSKQMLTQLGCDPSFHPMCWLFLVYPLPPLLDVVLCFCIHHFNTIFPVPSCFPVISSLHSYLHLCSTVPPPYPAYSFCLPFPHTHSTLQTRNQEVCVGSTCIQAENIEVIPPVVTKSMAAFL